MSPVSEPDPRGQPECIDDQEQTYRCCNHHCGQMQHRVSPQVQKCTTVSLFTRGVAPDRALPKRGRHEAPPSGRTGAARDGRTRLQTRAEAREGGAGSARSRAALRCLSRFRLDVRVGSRASQHRHGLQDQSRRSRAVVTRRSRSSRISVARGNGAASAFLPSRIKVVPTCAVTCLNKTTVGHFHFRCGRSTE